MYPHLDRSTHIERHRSCLIPIHCELVSASIHSVLSGRDCIESTIHPDMDSASPTMTEGITPKLLVPRDSVLLNSLNPVSELYSFDHPCPLLEPAQSASPVLGRRNLVRIPSDHQRVDALSTTGPSDEYFT